MLKKLIMLAGAGLMALTFAGAANAASFNIVGGTTVALDGNYDLSASTGLSSGTNVVLFDSLWWTSAPNTGGAGSYGLQLTGAPTTLKFEYLGSEAGDNNLAVYTESGNSVMFDNDTSSNGDFVLKTIGADGLVPFKFKNADGGYCSFTAICDDAANDTGIDGGLWGGLSIAFFQESATSVIALFGDGTLDGDYDDMAIRISVVPLPPALALFAGALAGLGWLSRRRKNVASA